MTSSVNPSAYADFPSRHIGIRAESRAKMLAELGYASLDDLIAAAVPGGIRTPTGLRLPRWPLKSRPLPNYVSLQGETRSASR